MRPELLALAASLCAREQRFALVTVVRREPPSSARVGDTALVTEGGEYHGWAGGGCTRETVVRESLRAIADGEPRFLSLSPDAAAAPRRGMVVLPMACDSGGTVEIYVEPVLPALRLAVFGDTPVVKSLVRVGEAMGYRVQSELKGAHVLIATMGDEDVAVLEKVLASEPAYVGVIASRKRFEQVRETLSQKGVPNSVLESVAAPAGLDIGARTPEEIALSVMAQIVERRRRSGAEIKPQAQNAEAVDPICGMSVTIATARHKAEVKGKAYYFCCAGCRTKFLAAVDA